MSKNAVNSDIVLEGQSNWELWIFVVKRIAEAGDVWEYIDPDQPHQPLQKPEKPIRPLPTINADGSTTQPSQQALMQYNQDASIYYREIKEYRRLRDRLGQVEAHITKTIQQDLLYHIKDKPTVHNQIKTLQALYSPTTADQEFRVQKAYGSAKVLHARRSNIEDWCSDFLTAYNRAKQLDLPEVHGFRAHKDLVRAIKQVDAAYAASISLDIFKAEETWNSNRIVPVPNQAQLPTVLADFLRYYRTTHSRKTNIHGGVFGATLNQEKSPYSKKRPRDNATPTKPCLCSDTHFWGQCPIQIDAGDDPADQLPHEAYAVFSSAFNYQLSAYPLIHSWVLDPATDIHICNNPADFQWKAPAADDDIVLAGSAEITIEAWGEVEIPLSTPNGIKTTTLKRVALIPSFFTSLVSLSRLSSSNIHFDSGRNVLYRTGTPCQDVANLTRLGGHWLVVHRSKPPTHSTAQTSVTHQAAASCAHGTLGKEHPETLTIINNLASLLQLQGKYEAAEEVHRRALEGREKVLGKEHPDTMTSVHCLAFLFHRQQRYNAALALYQRAISGYQHVLGPEDPTTLECVQHYSSLMHEMQVR